MTQEEKAKAAFRDGLKTHRMRLYKLNIFPLKVTDEIIEILNDDLRKAAHRRKAEENAQQGMNF